MRRSALRSLGVGGLSLYSREMHYVYHVYLIQSKIDASYYTGVTTDVEKRLREHNAERSQYSSGKIPFELAWHCVFHDKKLAYRFEKYLKSGSGIAFRNKHLL